MSNMEYNEVEELTDFIEDSEENIITEKKNDFIHQAGRAKQTKSRLGTYEHDLRITINRLVKECEENDIPIFVAYLGEHEGWVYNAIFPEETSHEEETGQFSEFLATVIDWNQDKNLKQVVIRNN